jgi:hypothetical protein
MAINDSSAIEGYPIKIGANIDTAAQTAAHPQAAFTGMPPRTKSGNPALSLSTSRSAIWLTT